MTSIWVKFIYNKERSCRMKEVEGWTDALSEIWEKVKERRDSREKRRNGENEMSAIFLPSIII